jgi:hypothetical protein
MYKRQLITLNESVPALHHRVFCDGAVCQNFGIDNAAHGGESNKVIRALDAFLESEHFLDYSRPPQLAGVVVSAIHCQEMEVLGGHISGVVGAPFPKNRGPGLGVDSPSPV